jgi:hypothetical protein
VTTLLSQNRYIDLRCAGARDPAEHTDSGYVIYLDETADREKAKRIVVDSKVSRHVALLESFPLSLFPSISSSHYHMSPLLQTDYLVMCNAVGTLLMH